MSAPSWLFSPLTRDQKAEIGRLASDAWHAELDRGRVVIPTGLTKTKALETWRHGQQQAAVKKDSLTDCTQKHFRKLKSHFLTLIGTPAASASAFTASMRTGKVRESAPDTDTHEGRELWLHKLREALHERDLPEAYAATICRRQYRCPLTNATPDQLRNLFITVRNRREKVSRFVPTETCPF